jgi:hypothetical protein
MPEAGFEPAVSTASGEELRLKALGRRDRLKPDLHCLLTLLLVFFPVSICDHIFTITYL